MDEKLALLGERVLVVGKNGRVQVVILNHYDKESDTYDGAALYPGFIRVKVEAGSAFQAGSVIEIVPTLPVKGLRQYPYAVRPDYAFQFVFPGEDIQPLLDIAQSNATRPAAVAVADQPVGSGEANAPDVLDTQPLAEPAQEFDPADRNEDGVVSSKERKQFERDR